MNIELVYAREPFEDLYEELLPLVEQHYEEIAWRKDRVPLAIDYERYSRMAGEGMLLCYTARKGSVLVGYAVFFLSHHPHYSETVFGANDIVWLRKDLRGGGHGKLLIDYCETDLKALGAQVISWHVKPQIDFGPLLSTVGYDPQDRVWLKWIGD